MSRYCPNCGNLLAQKKIEEKSRDYCNECEQVIWRNPKPVAWILIQKDEEFLLVKRAHSPDQGKWDIPGGFLELEEGFREAAVRELEEETGVEVDEKRIEFLDDISFQRGSEYVVGNIFCTEINEEPKLQAKDDAEDAKLWEIKALQNDKDEKLREVCKDILLRNSL